MILAYKSKPEVELKEKTSEISNTTEKNKNERPKMLLFGKKVKFNILESKFPTEELQIKTTKLKFAEKSEMLNLQIGNHYTSI